MKNGTRLQHTVYVCLVVTVQYYRVLISRVYVLPVPPAAPSYAQQHAPMQVNTLETHTFFLSDHGHLLKLSWQRLSLLFACQRGVAERLQHTVS